MAIRERLVYAIDVISDGAQRGLAGFRTSVAEADGATNKLKAGWQSASSTIQANAAALAVGAGTAIVAFGAKSVMAFQETALAAGKMADATGLAVEDASRWNEVAQDVGVSTDTITGAFVRLNKSIGSGALEEFGVELQRTADGAVDVNETMLEAIEVIGQIEDPTKRAQAAQAAFGRGYAEAAEIIFDSADNVQRKLGEVSESKVIDEDELRKAREFRESMDDLKDAAEDVALVTGEVLVPILGDLAEFLVAVRDRAHDAKEAIEEIPGGGDLLEALGTPLWDLPKKSKEQWDDLGRKIGVVPDEVTKVAKAFGEAKGPIDGVGDAIEDSADDTEAFAGSVGLLADAFREANPEIGRAEEALDFFGRALKDKTPAEQFTEAMSAANQVLGDLGETARDTADDIGSITEQFSEFREELDVQELLGDIVEDFEAVQEAASAAAEGGKEEARAHADAIRDLQRDVLDYVEGLEGIPQQRLTEIIAEIRSGDVDRIYQILSDLSQGVTVPVAFMPGTMQPGSSGIGSTFNPGTGGVSSNVQNPNPAPSQSAIPGGSFTQVTNIYPVGSTPTTHWQDGRIDDRRNGAR